MREYQRGLNPEQALLQAEAALSRSDLDADACYTLAMQLAGWPELHEVADCVNSLAQRLQRGRVLVPATELGAAWGAALAAVRSELDEREEVRDAA